MPTVRICGKCDGENAIGLARNTTSGTCYTGKNSSGGTTNSFTRVSWTPATTFTQSTGNWLIGGAGLHQIHEIQVFNKMHTDAELTDTPRHSCILTRMPP